MKIDRKNILFIGIIAIAMLLTANAGFAIDNNNLKEYDFDSYFKMNVPKDINFEKTDGNATDNITLSKSYKDNDKKINVAYFQTKNNAKDELIKYYKDMAKNSSSVSINDINNATVIHFGDENTYGDIEYHDMAIAGNATQYILVQCDNHSLMDSMANSIKFN
ncbi:hypothetical protein [Methanobrevibacter sp. UBA188]|uniref:hypothetical protein n=1 Tax=Methanobrevibacter sp. UBA188 TaxID=1915473 RepID=UPI0025D78181|nr:hypothetical protein [Methanobrevibacter sp. UBA188]